jgi:hypothetical protein
VASFDENRRQRRGAPVKEWPQSYTVLGVIGSIAAPVLVALLGSSLSAQPGPAGAPTVTREHTDAPAKTAAPTKTAEDTPPDPAKDEPPTDLAPSAEVAASASEAPADVAPPDVAPPSLPPPATAPTTPSTYKPPPTKPPAGSDDPYDSPGFESPKPPPKTLKETVTPPPKPAATDPKYTPGGI